MAARRPRVFDQAAFKAIIQQLGHSEKEAVWTAEQYKLAAPIALKELGQARLAEIIARYHAAYGLKTPDPLIATLARDLVQWSEHVLTAYEAERAAGEQDQEDEQP